MGITFGIINIFILVVMVCFTINDVSEGHVTSAIFHFVALLCFVVLTGILMSTPTAMEVYQGKTELRYIIQNNTIIDSVVVYKKEK